MHDTSHFLQALATVLCVAAVMTVAFQYLRLPVVLGYVLAGVVVGPHVPIPLVADMDIVHTLSELGVILVMFSLGLDFRLRSLLRLGPTALTAVIEVSVMLWLGYATADLLGFGRGVAICTGAIVAISSTTIIAKAFNEQAVRGPLRELVVGVLIVEDLIAILLLATLTTLVAGEGLQADVLARQSLRLFALLAGLVGLGMLFVPRSIRMINRLARPETTVVASIGVCFAIALLALELGYSVALGAFIAGSLIAESGEGHYIERLIQPVRDVFAAVFFVSVGMQIEPAILAEYWVAIVALTGVVIGGKVVSVSIGAFLTGHGMRTSVQAGMSLAQIGEFSFIIAALAVSLNPGAEFLYPVAVGVSAITTLTTPWLIQASGPSAEWVDRKLPKSLQMFAALYGSWLERLRTAPREQTTTAQARRLLLWLALDAALLAALVIGTSLGGGAIAEFVGLRFGASDAFANGLVIVGALALAAPLCAGIFRLARGIAVTLAAAALPEGRTGELDLSAAPRRVLVVALQLVFVLLVGMPLLALTQPFLPSGRAPLVFGSLLAMLGFAFWRSTTNLEGHVRAGAEVIIEALSAQARSGAVAPAQAALAQVRQLLPGLGEPVPVRVRDGSGAAGKSLADLNLRGLTGATVLAITRGDEAVIIPTAKEVLRPGDVIALAGSHEAVAAATTLLEAPSRASSV